MTGLSSYHNDESHLSMDFMCMSRKKPVTLVLQPAIRAEAPKGNTIKFMGEGELPQVETDVCRTDDNHGTALYRSYPMGYEITTGTARDRGTGGPIPV